MLLGAEVLFCLKAPASISPKGGLRHANILLKVLALAELPVGSSVRRMPPPLLKRNPLRRTAGIRELAALLTSALLLGLLPLVPPLLIDRRKEVTEVRVLVGSRALTRRVAGKVSLLIRRVFGRGGPEP